MGPIAIGAGMLGASLIGKAFNRGPGEYRAPQLKKLDYADIDLQTEVPELYNEIMRNDQLIARIENILNTRKQGATMAEMDALNANSSRMSEEQNAAGLLGTTAGMAAAGQARQRMEDSLRDRAFREEMGLYGALADQQARGAQFHQGVLGQVYNARNAQVQAENARAMAESEANYNRRAQNSAAINQLLSGVGNAGLSMVGTGLSNNAIASRPMPGSYGGYQGYGFGFGNRSMAP